MPEKRVAVIGGGPAGCSAAYQLNKAGRKVVLFERSSNLGGRTYTYRENGLQIDTGAGFFTNFYPLLLTYLEELNLKEQTPELGIGKKRKIGLVHNNEMTTLALGSPASLLSFPHVSLREKLRMAGKTLALTFQRGWLDLADPKVLSEYDVQSAASYARETVGENAYNFLVRPGVEPFWYFRCEEISCALVMALMARAVDARFYMFEKGMDTICTALARGLECRPEQEVTGISVADGKSPCLKVRSRSGEDQDEAFAQVVVATTATVAKELVSSLPDQMVTPFQKNFLNTQEYAANIHACYLVDSRAIDPELDLVAPCGPGNARLASIGNHGKSSGLRALLPRDRELLGVFFSGEASAEMMGEDRQVLLDRCWDQARSFYRGFPVEADPVEVFVRREAIPVPKVGRYRMAARFLAEQKAPMVFAGDYLTTATVEGALRSGWWAARRLMESQR